MKNKNVKEKPSHSDYLEQWIQLYEKTIYDKSLTGYFLKKSHEWAERSFTSDTKFSNVLEVGSGSGVLGLLLARDYDIELTQVEKQELFFKYTQKNAQVNKIENELFHSDFLKFQYFGKYSSEIVQTSLN